MAAIAEFEEQVLSELDRISLLDAATFEPSHRKRPESVAKPLSDAFWNEMRKR